MDASIVVSFIIIGIYSVLSIKNDRSNYSLNKTFWFFNLFFLCVSPLFHYYSSYKPWLEGGDIQDYQYLYANTLIIFSFIAYSLVRHISPGWSPRIVNFNSGTLITKSKARFLTLFSVVCFVFLCYLIGFENIFFRSSNKIDASSEQIINLSITSFLRITPLAALAFIKLGSEKNAAFGSILKYEITLFPLIFLSNFPASVTRFWFGSVFIGLFVIYFCNKKMLNRLYDGLFVLVFCILFPVFFMFKYVTFKDVSLKDVVSQIDIGNSFNSVDFDAYYLFIQSLAHVKQNGVNLGESIIITITSFIPRSVLPSKGLPSPYTVGESQGLQYLELSFPYVAEGYYAFGFIGVLMFSAFISILIKVLDNNYWDSKVFGEKRLGFSYVIYPFLLGLSIYALRGSMYAGFVQTILFCAPFAFIYFLISLKFKI